MAYYCKKYSGECTGCDACRPTPAYECSACDDPIYPGETYFDVGDQVYCQRCIELARETA